VEEFEQQVHCRMTDDNSSSNNNSDIFKKSEKKNVAFLTN